MMTIKEMASTLAKLAGPDASICIGVDGWAHSGRHDNPDVRVRVSLIRRGNGPAETLVEHARSLAEAYQRAEAEILRTSVDVGEAEITGEAVSA